MSTIVKVIITLVLIGLAIGARLYKEEERKPVPVLFLDPEWEEATLVEDIFIVKDEDIIGPVEPVEDETKVARLVSRKAQVKKHIPIPDGVLITRGWEHPSLRAAGY